MHSRSFKQVSDCALYLSNEHFRALNYYQHTPNSSPSVLAFNETNKKMIPNRIIIATPSSNDNLESVTFCFLSRMLISLARVMNSLSDLYF